METYRRTIDYTPAPSYGGRVIGSRTSAYTTGPSSYGSTYTTNLSPTRTYYSNYGTSDLGSTRVYNSDYIRDWSSTDGLRESRWMSDPAYTSDSRISRRYDEPSSTYLSSTSFPSGYYKDGSFSNDTLSISRPSTRYDRYDDYRRDDHLGGRVHSSITLYQFPISTNCLQISCLLLDTNIPFETVNLENGTAKGGTKHPDFLAINPLGQVPTLRDGDFVVYESMTILRYIANAFHLPDHFYPSNPRARADCEMLMDWRQTVFYPALSEMVYPYMGWKPDHSGVSEGKRKFLAACEFLSRNVLKGNSFVLGPQPCIADYAIVFPLEMCSVVPGFLLPREIDDYKRRFTNKSRNADRVCRALRDFIETRRQSNQ